MVIVMINLENKRMQWVKACAKQVTDVGTRWQQEQNFGAKHPELV